MSVLSACFDWEWFLRVGVPLCRIRLRVQETGTSAFRLPPVIYSLTQRKGHNSLSVFARLALFTLADILPSPLMASGTLVGSLSVHEKGHLWNNMLKLPGRRCVHRGSSQPWQTMRHGGSVENASPGRRGLQGPLGRCSYFTASLRNGTIELASNVTQLLRLKTESSLVLSSKQSRRR